NFVVHDFFCRDGRREWSLFDKFLSGLASNWHETRFSRHFVSMHPSNWHETRFSRHFVSPHLSPSKKTASTRKLWRFHQIKIYAQKSFNKFVWLRSGPTLKIETLTSHNLSISRK